MIFSIVTLQLLPPQIGGLIYCALLAALVTGADSFILQGSSNLTHDFYRRLTNPGATNRQMMFVSRLTVALVALAALLIAFHFSGIIAIYQWARGLRLQPLSCPFWPPCSGGEPLARAFWPDGRRAHRNAGLALPGAGF